MLDGCFCFDFQKAAFGRLTVELDAADAGEVQITFSECQSGNHADPAPGGFRRAVVDRHQVSPGRNTLICRIPQHKNPYGNQHKCMLPPPGGEVMPFRYVDVQGENVSNVSCIRIAFFGGFDDEASFFESSDEKLNKVWDFCKYSIKATSLFDCYVDGDRERLPYEADAYINQLCAYCCDNDYSRAKRTIDTLFRQPTWPIEWRLIMPNVVEDYLLYSGDRASVEFWRDALDKSLLTEYLADDALIPSELKDNCNNETIRAIIDWPMPERDDYEIADKSLVPNCYQYSANMAMYRMYGDKKYLQQAETVKKTLRELMSDKGIFFDHADTRHTAVHSAVFPIAFGIAEAAEYPELMQIIRNRGMKCSVYGAHFLLEACYIAGDADFALELMRSESSRSWLNMIAAGSTIAMEAWSNEVKPNQDWNHAWGAAPANIIARRLCGIRPETPGFETFSVEPQPASLTYFKYRQPTPHGAIVVEYNANEAVKITHPSGKQETLTAAKGLFKLDY